MTCMDDKGTDSSSALIRPTFTWGPNDQYTLAINRRVPHHITYVLWELIRFENNLTGSLGSLIDSGLRISPYDQKQ